jgi:hypothetical protein
VHHLASSFFFFFFFFFFVVVFVDDFRPHSGEFKRQDGIPLVVTIEKRNDAKRKWEDKRRAFGLRGGRRDERARDGVFSSSVLGARCNDKLFEQQH